ncbi:molecular chaperone [Coniosporium apollinis]|uniref:Molecular chaperone n=1 Tax=Coniosporium apollinis TaxID=61459 RepID=A0ABQ9PA66_9PEZI|nr:molecular chaperone [Coniosporium apollinis]
MRPITPATLSWLRAATDAAFPSSALASQPHRQACIYRCSWNQHRNNTSSSRRRHFSTTRTRRVEAASPPQTHYHFFPRSLPSGPPPQGAFAVDLNQLKREFLQLQAQAHPDRHSQENKRKAEAMSARINEAYKTLENPLLRAQYLLSLRGIDVAEDESAKVEDPELLMEVLEAREDIEAAESDDEIRAMKEVNNQRIEESVGVLEDAFMRDDMDLAKSEAVKLRYWINIKQSLDDWEPGKPVVLIH